MLDYNNAFMTPIHHPVSAIVYSALGHEVTSVMIDGRFVMRDGIVGAVDEAAVRRQAQTSADALTQRAGTDSFNRRPWPKTVGWEREKKPQVSPLRYPGFPGGLGRVGELSCGFLYGKPHTRFTVGAAQ